NGITGSYDSGTGILTLSGTATKAQYKTALQSITFDSTSDDPGNGDRTISFKINDGDTDSAADTATVHVSPVNDAPTVDVDGVSTYTEGGAAQVIDASITVTDPDDTNL